MGQQGNGNIDWTASYIDDEWLELAGVYHVDDVEGAEIIGRKARAGSRYRGIVIPYTWPGDPTLRMARLRRDQPDLEREPDGRLKEVGKYLSPPGRKNLIYFPPKTDPGHIVDTEVPAIIVEGEKKAIALQRYFTEIATPTLVIGLSGVWNWRGVVETLRDVNGHRWADVRGTISDFQRITWKDRSVTILFDTNVLTNAFVRSARFSLARYLREVGACEVIARTLPIEEGLNGPDDFLGKYGPAWMTDFLNQPHNQAKPVTDPDTLFNPSETLTRPKELSIMGLAARFHERYYLNTRYVEARGVFYNYIAGLWTASRCCTEQKTKAVINEIHEEAKDAEARYQLLSERNASLLSEQKALCMVDREASQELIALANHLPAIQKFLPKIKSPATMDAILAFARSDLLIGADDFDPDHSILNLKTGTIDLDTGNHREHRATDLCSMQSPVEYQSQAECPRWLRFLHEIFLADQELIDFIQRAIGYSLSGHTSEQVFLILYGDGSNGKSELLSVLDQLLGSYLKSANVDTFMDDRPNNGHNEDIARLRGARLVTTTETEKTKRLAEGLVKRLTGGDIITASYKHERTFQFVPRFKVWLAANHKPNITGTDFGIWRRILLVPFRAKFVKPNTELGENEQFIDPTLKADLTAELPGILNWAVEGYRKWKQIGLAPPDIVREASEEYRKESDRLGNFISDQLIDMPGVNTRFSHIYETYLKWSEDNGIKQTMTKITFSKELRHRGMEIGTEGKGHVKVLLNWSVKYSE